MEMVSCRAESLTESPPAPLPNLFTRCHTDKFLAKLLQPDWEMCGMGTDMEVLCGLQILRVDGGASANNLMLQMQADLLQVQVMRPAYMETTAIGAAFAAGKHPRTPVYVTATYIIRGSV